MSDPDRPKHKIFVSKLAFPDHSIFFLPEMFVPVAQGTRNQNQLRLSRRPVEEHRCIPTMVELIR